VFEAWLPIGKIRHDLVKSIGSNNVTQIVDGSLYLPLTDAACIAVKPAVANMVDWICSHIPTLFYMLFR
jgi:hypothetical protein